MFLYTHFFFSVIIMVYIMYGYPRSRDFVLITHFLYLLFHIFFFLLLFSFVLYLRVCSQNISSMRFFIIFFFCSLCNLFDYFVLKINLVENWVFYLENVCERFCEKLWFFIFVIVCVNLRI